MASTLHIAHTVIVCEETSIGMKLLEATGPVI